MNPFCGQLIYSGRLQNALTADIVGFSAIESYCVAQSGMAYRDAEQE